MKHLLLLVISLACLTFARADITVTQTTENAGGPMTKTVKIVMRIKGNRVRLDSGEHLSILLDTKTGSRITLMHAMKKMIASTAQQEIERMQRVSRVEHRSGFEKPPVMTATGRKEVINGFAAEEYTWKTDMASGRFWLCPNIPDAAEICTAMDAFAKPMRLVTDFPVVDPKQGVPVRTELTQKMPIPPGLPPEAATHWPAETTSVMLITQISDDPIDPHVFDLPADYRPMNDGFKR
jgi:hypothetical protein